jgi:hypothetical protein
MLRLALGWLLLGFVIGAAMLVDRELPGQWRRWLSPGHGHMLFVGWFLQFAVGVAYWLLPRKRSPEQPIGYAERPAYLAVIALNTGLILRVGGEARERAGHSTTEEQLLQLIAYVKSLSTPGGAPASTTK